MLVKFATLVIDPPWPYRDRLRSGPTKSRVRGAANHYPTMTLRELHALPVAAIAAANAHCYLWTTNAFVREADALLEAWGFAQKTVLTWVKPQIGMGHYFRNNTEHVLFGVCGRLPTRRKNVPTAFFAPRAQHSRKPDTFYEIVETQSPGPYLELFARRERHGWVTVGDALDGRPIRDVLTTMTATR
jgi:N6-adenosine-specific RNA methylase IME4